MKQKPKKKGSKIILWIVLSLLLIAIIGAIVAKKTILAPFNLKETAYLYIDKEKNYEDVISQLKKANLPSEQIFRILSERMNYPNNVKTGRYAIKDGMTMPDVIRMLRTGNQTPVNLTFNNMRTKEDLAGRISQQLMMDSTMLLNALNDPAKIKEFGFDESTFPAMFIPNTYEVYWDTSIDNLLNRMKKEYDRFWNDNRKSKAENIGLSPVQVSTLASIVEEEATYPDEYPVIAGLYLNRLKKGMRLEADPTVKFAVGDFSLRRILFRHLEVESPYNTYKNTGLPPGPIRIPSIKAIDGTLSPQQHNYLFMCAKEDLSGRHNFAATHAEHARNAARYQRALNQKGIY
ncbi:MAG TPA: endolytic transglycosylase MltG [Petrimonas sp.]|uniref:endolytic transglycosylase MltG n=1 Tax=Petrimonas sp. TaxID=2023866 RepID=UPI000960EF17|nr:MAG: aminodeoxychorismate lyase [Bacteroidia bacterium 43-41]HHV86632.1 endolytic transglycosylase MltG [Petrimonas sp.]